MKKHRLLSLLALAFVPGVALAGYAAVGPIKGSVCSFGGMYCKFHTLVAFKGEDGRPHELRRRFESVSDFNGRGSEGQCFIRTRSSGAGIISWATNALSDAPVFYERDDDGSLEEVEPEYVTFKCIRY